MAFFLMLGIFSRMVSLNLHYDISSLEFEYNKGLTKLRIPGIEITDIPGEPELPVECIKIALPYHSRIKNIEVKKTCSVVVPGSYELTWAQPPVILSRKEPISKIGPKEMIYNSADRYPSNNIEFKGIGILDNQQILELAIYPLEYYPALKRFVLY